jgi:putative ABC transport system permease protein
MQSSVDISWWILFLFSGTLLIPFMINRYYQLELGKDILISSMRMFLQLSLVGLYLEFVFDLNSLLLNLTWLAVMILVGSSAIVGKAKLPRKQLLLPVASGLFIGLLPVISILCLAVVDPKPWYSAQYLIPLSGMLLGNSLAGNIVALQNLYGAFEERKAEYEGAIALAVNPHYAARPFVRDALRKAMAPILASMTTTGLVTLPGMMTGQILGGVSPLIAIKYQLVILIAIFVMMSISLTVSLQLSLNNTLHPSGRLLVKIQKSS